MSSQISVFSVPGLDVWVSNTEVFKKGISVWRVSDADSCDWAASVTFVFCLFPDIKICVCVAADKDCSFSVASQLGTGERSVLASHIFVREVVHLDDSICDVTVLGTWICSVPDVDSFACVFDCL